jgi:hypothetical protein
MKRARAPATRFLSQRGIRPDEVAREIEATDWD